MQRVGPVPACSSSGYEAMVCGNPYQHPTHGRRIARYIVWEGGHTLVKARRMDGDMGPCRTERAGRHGAATNQYSCCARSTTGH